MKALVLSKVILARFVLLTAVAMGLVAVGVEQSRGATFPLGASGDIPINVNFPANTLLSFTLALGAPAEDVVGSLVFSVKLPGNIIVSSVAFTGGPSFAGTQDYGLRNGDHPNLDLYDETQWQVDLGPAPIAGLTVAFDNFFLFRLAGGDLNATLTIDGIDIPVGQTPVPAALPLFAGGLGVIAFASTRRRKLRA